MSLIKTFSADQLTVAVYDSEAEMGKGAAADAAAAIVKLQQEKEEINIIFAAAVSQDEFLNALITYPEIEWNKINAFHMDEYHGLASSHPKSLAYFLCSHALDRMPVKNRFFIDGSNPDYAAECKRYAALLEEYPPDLVFMGIGDNGHLAFNDPHVANFKDTVKVKMVEIDDISKQQQVNAKNFENMDAVPSLAFTVTIPALLDCKQIFCVVPTHYKAEATHNTIYGEISETCPASILRTCPHAKLYLDNESSSRLTL